MPKRLEWHERCYQVYALIDPRDNTIRYIGKSGDMQRRYYEHIHLAGGGWNEKKWVNELKDLGLSPVLQILETVDADDASYKLVLQREQYWIDKLVAMGAPLIDVFGVTKPYPQQSKVPLRPYPKTNTLWKMS